eukprot:COSAG06_NODE_768_length_12452_cov_5.484537_8_plen_151_part_00
MAKPLTELTTDKFGRDISDAWESDPKYQQAFDALKEKLCEYPVLRLPDLSKPYVCCSDASDYALGAALCQEVDRKLGIWTLGGSKYSDWDRWGTRSITSRIARTDGGSVPRCSCILPVFCPGTHKLHDKPNSHSVSLVHRELLAQHCTTR